ncbi:MAG: 30S ribosomal protein S2 [Acidobacteria bacterium]|nr:30S ribosomal protein S2 [Acidobacteriota bacterium]MCA1637894.1 30S ribosomal protein S2 [Acidobacteriota bacterium]
MATVTMKELLEAGVHFGHQVRRWNPKMKEYIFGERNGIYIIDLQKTQKLFRDALGYVQEALTENPKMKVLFVGTKRQAQDAIREEAERCGQFYVNNRWLGGLMTNFQTVQQSVKKMKDIETMREDGRFEMLTKKERLQLDRQHESLMKNLAGIKEMNGTPDMLFVIDVRKEDIAVAEANRLNIPVVAVVDTNCSPEGINHVIPGNDDALRAIRLFASRIADAILEGQQIATEGSVAALETDTETTDGDTERLEPTIQVADRSWDTAEETHPISPEPEDAAAGVKDVYGAYGNQEPTPVKVEVPHSASEAIREATSENAPKEEPVQEETTEATAS